MEQLNLAQAMAWMVKELDWVYSEDGGETWVSPNGEVCDGDE